MFNNQSKANILICDDEPDIAIDIKSRLKNIGYTVCGTPYTGKDALSLTEQHRPDLVFIDIDLKGEIDGTKTADCILKKWSIPVVFLNTDTGSDKLKRAQPTYPFGYLLRPFKDKDLKITVEMALFVGKLDAKRIKAEKSLENSELWLRNTFESLEEAIFSVTTDRRLVNFNRAAEKMLGFSMAEVANLSTAVLHVDQEHYVEFGNKLKIPFSKGETAQFEFLMKRKNGEIFPTEHSVSLIKNNSGESIGIVSVIRDITSRKKAEATLKESEERFREIVQNSEAGYFFIDKDGIIQDVNHSWLKLYKYSSREEVIGNHFTVIQKEDAVVKAHESVSGIMRGDPQYLTGEFSRKCKDGSIGYHTFSARPAIRSGEVIGIEGFIIDDTERKKFEQEREELIADLKKALQEIKTLQGFIPICAHCKKIRDDEGFWQQLEHYIAERTEAQFSHGLCPDCMKDFYQKYNLR